MSKRRDRRSKVQNSNFSILSIMPWMFGTLLIIGMIGYFFIRPAPVDQKTFCDEKGNISGITVIVVDVSDKLSLSQKARLKNELFNISNTSPTRSNPILSKGEKLIVYFIEPEGIKPSLVFSMCHPGDITKRSFLEKISEGESFAKKKWEKFSNNILEEIDKKIENSQDLSTSPILESIQYIRSKEFPPPDLMSEVSNYNFIIWSDMIQNSDTANHFKELKEFKKVLKENPLILNEIKFSIFQLMSKKYSKFQNNEQLLWWRKIFSSSKAKLKSWEPL